MATVREALLCVAESEEYAVRGLTPGSIPVWSITPSFGLFWTIGLRCVAHARWPLGRARPIGEDHRGR